MELLNLAMFIFCDLLTTIQENTEMLEYIDEPEFEIQQTSDPTNNGGFFFFALCYTNYNNSRCMPTLHFIIYLLFKPTKITAKVMEEAELEPKKYKRSK